MVARLDFDDDEQVGSAGHNVKLIVAVTPIDVQNAIAALLQILAGYSLASASDLGFLLGHTSGSELGVDEGLDVG